MPKKSFPTKTISEISKTKYFYIRAGDDHKFIAVWVVVIDGRVLVRSWNDKPTGWYRAMVKAGHGAIKVGTRIVEVRATRVRSAKLLDAMDESYAAKYTTKPNARYVEGFATAARRANTVELIPA